MKIYQLEKRTAIRLRFPQRIGRSKKKLKQSGYQRIRNGKGNH